MNTHTIHATSVLNAQHLFPNQDRQPSRGQPKGRSEHRGCTAGLPTFPCPGKDELGARGVRSGGRKKNKNKNRTKPEKKKKKPTQLKVVSAYRNLTKLKKKIK